MVEEPDCEGGHQRGEMADSGREEESTGKQDPIGFFQSGQAVLPVRQVVERSHQQNTVKGRLRPGQRSRVAHLRRGQMEAVRRGVLDLDGRQVQQMCFVALGTQPIAVGAGGASDIENAGGRRRQMALENLLGPKPLQPAPPGFQARRFGDLVIVVGYVAHFACLSNHPRIYATLAMWWLGRTLMPCGSSGTLTRTDSTPSSLRA